METYCGKNCGTCTVREAENCPGCRQIADRGGCEIASCCREKGHESCATCTQRTWCPTVRKSFSMHKYRKEQAEAEAASAERLREKAAVMGKWITPLFWVMLVLQIIGLGETIFENTPVVPLVLQGMTVLIVLFHAFCLWQVRSAGDRYRIAALFTMLSGLIAGAVDLLNAFTSLGGTLGVIVAIPGAVCSYIAVYNEYNAHAEALADADGELAEKWEKLWKWTIASLIGVFLAVPVSAVLGVIGLLLMVASLIAEVVCLVLELVYLHRTADIFRWYMEN